jgi:hypothetical protein
MKFTSITAALLLPLLAVATTTDAPYPTSGSPVTTLTKTTHITLTKTLSKVVAAVTSTYGSNSTTTVGPTAVGTGSTTLSSPSGTGAAPSQTSAIGAASSLNSMYAGSAGVVIMVAAAFL